MNELFRIVEQFFRGLFESSAPLKPIRVVKRNNPLNIRKSSNAWLGKVDNNSAFEQFETLDYGIRAGFVILKNYMSKYKLVTLKDIITRFAPPSENDTVAYIDYVNSRLGWDNHKIFFEPEPIARLVAVMSEMEQGKQNAVTYGEVLNVVKKFNLWQ